MTTVQRQCLMNVEPVVTWKRGNPSEQSTNHTVELRAQGSQPAQVSYFKTGGRSKNLIGHGVIQGKELHHGVILWSKVFEGTGFASNLCQNLYRQQHIQYQWVNVTAIDKSKQDLGMKTEAKCNNKKVIVIFVFRIFIFGILYTWFK